MLNKPVRAQISPCKGKARKKRTVSLHFLRAFSEDVGTRTLSLPKGWSPRQPALQMCLRAAHPQQEWPKHGHCPETRFLPMDAPSRASELPTCLGPSGRRHPSLSSSPCTSGRGPAGPWRRALWGNATGWSSQRSGVPGELWASWETKKEKKSFLNLS